MVGTAAITENLLKRKWSATILRHLDQGITDPAEILKREEQLSAAVMNERLRTMHRYTLIARFPQRGPSMVVEYRLTPRGRKVLKVLNIIDELDQIDLPPAQIDDKPSDGLEMPARRVKILPPANKQLILKD